MGDTVQTLAAVIQNLRNLFKDKDRLVGIDDWDNFIGCICALEDIGIWLQEQNKPEENEQKE